MTKPTGITPPLTKLAPPSSESQWLARPDVLANVCALSGRKVVVVTAPTGSGKSTLLAQAYVALAAQGLEVCWLSLDASDNNPQRFIAHLIAALQRARTGVGGRLWNAWFRLRSWKMRLPVSSMTSPPARAR